MKLADDCRKYATDGPSITGALAKASLHFGRAHAQIEKERDNMHRAIGTQVRQLICPISSGHLRLSVPKHFIYCGSWRLIEAHSYRFRPPLTGKVLLDFFKWNIPSWRSIVQRSVCCIPEKRVKSGVWRVADVLGHNCCELLEFLLLHSQCLVRECKEYKMIMGLFFTFLSLSFPSYLHNFLYTRLGKLLFRTGVLTSSFWTSLIMQLMHVLIYMFFLR